MSATSRSTLLGLLVLVSACGDSTPGYTLQQVMFEIDLSKLRLEEALILPEGLESARMHAGSIERWLRDPAFEAYVESERFPGDTARFAALRSEFEGAFAELSGALAAGDLEAARTAYPRMLGACTTCHDVYRPGL